MERNASRRVNLSWNFNKNSSVPFNLKFGGFMTNLPLTFKFVGDCKVILNRDENGVFVLVDDFDYDISDRIQFRVDGFPTIEEAKSFIMMGNFNEFENDFILQHQPNYKLNWTYL